MDEVVERATKAFVAAYLGHLEDAATGERSEWWDLMDDKVKERHRRSVRAAIEALREPTHKMREEGRLRLSDCVSFRIDPEGDSGFEYDDPQPVWAAMIDELLLD